MTRIYEDMEVDEVAVVANPANPLAKVKVRKRLDPKAAKDVALTRFKKRVDKSLVRAKARLHEELAAIERGEPITKRKKRRRMVVEEDQILTGGKQPSRLGPQSHSYPDQYPVGKREVDLQKAADRYCESVKLSGGTPGDQFAESRAMYKSYRDNLFNGAIRQAEYQPAVGPDPRYDALMAKATRLAKRDPTKTAEQHFAALYESPTEVMKRASPPPGSSETDDDDDDPTDEPDGDWDDSDEKDGMDLRPDRGEPPASVAPGGRSVADYEMSGTNTALAGSQAATGRSGGSYSPTRRSPSGTRR